MKSFLASFVLAAATLIAVAVTQSDDGTARSTIVETTWIAIGLALLAVAALLLGAFLVGLSRGRPFLRLDWFLPFVKRGRFGVVRKALQRIGPTALSSPIRRVVQLAALVLFLVLFFFACWPYGAQPAPPGQVSSGWRLAEIDQESGSLSFERDSALEWPNEAGQQLFLVGEDAIASQERRVGAFTVVGTHPENRLLVKPEGELSPELLDALLLSTGAWTFHETDPDRWPSHYTDELAARQFIPVESFLLIDPLVSISTAVASRSWVWSLGCAAGILIVCIVVPRAFCGYLCPLGTLIDGFDWLVSVRFRRFRVPDDGCWVHIKYYLLAGTLICAVSGVLVSGYVAAIPVVTRAMLFLGEPLQTGLVRGRHLIAPIAAGHIVSIALFAAVLLLGLMRPRFWCKYVCPSGAVFSLGNLFRTSERKVESTCIHCNKCVEICPFDAIKADFTTRVTDCTLCQSCGGACPVHAIKFVGRWNAEDLKAVDDPPTGETSLGRRGFISTVTGSVGALVGGAGLAAGIKHSGARLDAPSSLRPVRPPGSVPEREFLQLCIRCGECFKVCPNNVLQAEGFQQGIEGLWAPLVNANWAGCESSCNVCGQVCPTGAIRALPLEEKRVARMGLAIVNQQTCLPLANREACQLCVDECNAAGYRAIEFMQVHTAVDDQGFPLPDTGYLAPVVLPEECVGCGLCQTRCFGINVKERKLLTESAIVVEAGDGREDRLSTGSYIRLREEEARRKADLRQSQTESTGDFFIPDSEDAFTPDATVDDPFGTSTPDVPKRIDGQEANPFE